MSEPAKKATPESYSPRELPEIIGMAQEMRKQLEKRETPKAGVSMRGGRTMTKLQNMRVIEIPAFRAVSSGPDTFANIFGKGGFDQWIGAHGHFLRDHFYAHPDFMWHEEDNIDKSVWIWAIQDGVTKEDCAPYEIITFEGGIYLVATGNEDDPRDLGRTYKGMMKWIKKSKVFESDHRPGHYGMCHMTGCGAIQQALGFAQQEIFLPVKFKREREA